MSHYYCSSCTQTTSEMSVCETDTCARQWEMMEECSCTDGTHGKQIEMNVTDSNGNRLQNGDDVTLIKDLTLRGTSQVIKRGTKVKGIRLTDNANEVDCKINGTAIVLRTEFLKKL